MTEVTYNYVQLKAALGTTWISWHITQMLLQVQIIFTEQII